MNCQRRRLRLRQRTSGLLDTGPGSREFVVSNSKVRPAAGLSRRELLQRGSLGTAGVLSLGALVTLLDACSSGGSSAASGPLPAALGSGGMAALAEKAKSEGRLNVRSEEHT